MLNNPRMAELHALEAPARVRELEEWGAVFDRTRDGRILQRSFGGHSYPRLAHVGDRTGLEMIRTLQDRAVAMGMTVYMEHTITHLTRNSAGVTGAFGYRRVDGRPVLFPAKAVILATGGIGKAFEITSNSWEYSGDGQALALRAGAELIDMEFVQFHPTGMVWPPGVRGLLVTEAVRGEGGILRNKDGKRFMWDYLPEDRRHEYAATDEEARTWVEALSASRQTDARRPPELSTRDNVARAIYTEVKENRGSPHGGVFLDISYLPAEHVRRKLPSMYDQFKELADVDITAGPMEVGPTTHYVMGGIRVDADTGATTVPGLFAAGEVSGGMHGANRLGGNSLSDLLVFGQRAGAGAVAHAAALPAEPHVDPTQVRTAEEELDAPLARTDGTDPYRLREELQAVMQSLVGIFRTKDDLNTAIRKIEDIRGRSRDLSVDGGRAFNPGWNLVFEVRNLIEISEAIARSALARKESRGAHSRLDHPETKPDWAKKNVVVRLEGETMAVSTSPIPAMPDELRALAEAGGAH
jgi:succinate dehydrogenase / fumarate reductase flavoprotein subunit